MPHILTHYIVMDLLLNKEEKNRQAALVGAQGPDPFYYYGIGDLVKKHNEDEVRDFGHLLHHHDVAPIISFMVEYMNNQKDDWSYLVLKQYIKGFLLHYCIDRNTHPYIFYRTGFTTGKDTNSAKYNWFHAVFECHLDVLFRKRYNIHNFNPKACLALSNKQLKTISLMYYHLARQLFPTATYITRHTFYQSVKCMKRVNSFLYSPTGVKKRYFEKHNFFTLKNALCHPLKVNDDNKVDYLNNSHSIWKDPTSGQEHDSSFIDMIEDAKKEYKEIVSILEFKQPELIKHYALKFSKSIDHDGKPLKSTKCYFDVFYNDDFPL